MTLVPTLCVGTHSGRRSASSGSTQSVEEEAGSHAERGNQRQDGSVSKKPNP